MNNMFWEDKFQKKILNKAFAYYNRDSVKIIRDNEQTVIAEVSGSNLYTVVIEQKPEKITDMYCSCPHADSGANCKHMAAVLYHVNKVEKFEVHDDEPVSLKEDSEFTEFADLMPREYMNEYKDDIKSIFYQYVKRGSVSYSSANQMFFELENFIDTDIHKLINVNENNAAFELTKQIILKLGNLSIDDSGGGLSFTLDSIQYTWRELLEHGNDKLINKMFQWMMRERKPSKMGVTEDYIEEFLFNEFTEERFLQKKLILVEKKLNTIIPEEYTSYNRNYEMGEWALRYLKLKKELDGDLNNVKEFIQTNIHLPGVRDFYTEECINQEEYDKAIQLLEDGKITEVTFPGVVHKYSLQLKNLYKQLNDDDKYRNELWQLIIGHGDLTVYDEIKAQYSAEEWLEKQGIIFDELEKKPYSKIDTIYRSEGMYDRLLNLALRQNGTWMVHKYKNVLVEKFPEVVLDKYVQNIEDMAAGASNRKRYWTVVTELREIKKLRGGENVVNEIAERWKEIYKNRPAMMDELSRL